MNLAITGGIERHPKSGMPIVQLTDADMRNIQQLQNSGFTQPYLPAGAGDIIIRQHRAGLKAAFEKGHSAPVCFLSPAQGGEWEGLKSSYSYDAVPTGVAEKELRLIAAHLAAVPEGFGIHRKLRRIMERTGVGEDGAREVLEGMSPQRRLIGQEEVAELVVRLAADGMPGIHGQAINLDGGGVSS